MKRKPGPEVSKQLPELASSSLIGGVSPWDILSYLGEIYVRVRSIRTTLYQMRYNLVVLPEPSQNPEVEFTLVWALPQIIFSAVEALEVLRILDQRLAPKTQIYTKVLRKWEAFRDDSAHYALRLFFAAPGKDDFRISMEGVSTGAVRGFSYSFEDDLLKVGDQKGQAMSIVDALNALKATFQEAARKVRKYPEAFPEVSERDYNISRTMAFYEDELEKDIDAFNDTDAHFQSRFPLRAKRIKSLLGKSQPAESDIYKALHDEPRSIVKQMLSSLVRDKAIRATESNGVWYFSASPKSNRRKVRKTPLTLE